MLDFAHHVVELFEEIHPLDRIARAGYVLRGVTEPESVAAHSHFVSVMALLFADKYPDLFDRERVLTMALIHDLSEAQPMDIPMPAGDAYLREASSPPNKPSSSACSRDSTPNTLPATANSSNQQRRKPALAIRN